MLMPDGTRSATEIFAVSAGMFHVCSRIGLGSETKLTRSQATRVSGRPSNIARRDFEARKDVMRVPAIRGKSRASEGYHTRATGGEAISVVLRQDLVNVLTNRNLPRHIRRCGDGWHTQKTMGFRHLFGYTLDVNVPS